MDKKQLLENVTVVNLADDLGYLDEVCMCMWTEWSQHYGAKLEDVVYRTSHCLHKDRIPQTHIVKDKDKLAGFVSLWNNDLPFRQDLTPWIATLFIKEEYRGMGLGTLLQKHCIQVVKDLGYKELYLITDHENYYERSGWKYVENAPAKGGTSIRLYAYEIK